MTKLKRIELSAADMENAVLQLIENGAALSPHKQARAHGRYAPVVIAKAIGVRVDVVQEMLARMLMAGRIEIVKQRGGERFAVSPEEGATVLTPVDGPCPLCRHLVTEELLGKMRKWLDDQRVVAGML